jgi:hypothetical protein
VAKLVSEAWRELPPDERKKWEDMAKEDRARYEEERRTYRGPWKVAVSKKPYKDPNAPKRPMSAFLMYSNGRRAAVKKENPDFSNGEISRLLSEMWRKASEEDRQKYIKEEFELRTKYKEDMAKWKKEAEEKEKELVAKQAEEELNNPPPHREALAGLTNYSAMLASNPAAATSYLAAMAGAGSGTSQFEELAMQRARSQLEAEQRARMLAQLGGAGMDAGADMYSRYAVAAAAAGGGYPSAGGFGQYPDMLGAGKSLLSCICCMGCYCLADLFLIIVASASFHNKQPPTHMPVSFVKNKNFASNSSCLLSKNKITKQPWPCMLNNNNNSSSSNKGHSMVVDKISNRQLPCSIPTVAHLIITTWWTEAMANSSKIRHWNLSLRQQQRRDMEMVDIKRKCSDKPLILVVVEVGSFEVHENTHRRRWADGGTC